LWTSHHSGVLLLVKHAGATSSTGATTTSDDAVKDSIEGLGLRLLSAPMATGVLVLLDVVLLLPLVLLFPLLEDEADVLALLLGSGENMVNEKM
jgi:hypothetical protein